MGRNIIICCDGTNNDYGVVNTSIVRVLNVLERDEGKQLIYYEPGVGTMPEARLFTRTGKAISRGIALALATDLKSKVLAAYTYLSDTWRDDDRIFLFGFSRGAYTARALAGMVRQVGLLQPHNHSLAPYAMRAYTDRIDPAYWKVGGGFRSTFGRRKNVGVTIPIHFMGIWDTVSSVGYLRQPRFPYVSKNPAVRTIRHAISLDERRWFFRQNRVTDDGPQDLVQLWFPGVHSDVGGGYAEDRSGLWRTPFHWIVSEAETAGLLVNRRRYNKILGRTPLEQSWCDPSNNSMTKGWQVWHRHTVSGCTNAIHWHGGMRV